MPQNEPQVILTDEEKSSVESWFKMMLPQDGSSLVVKEELADDSHRMLVAQGLDHYASQVVFSDITKSIEAIKKAYFIFPIPIFLYYLADYYEKAEKIEDAKDAYNSFIKAQVNYKPGEIAEVYLKQLDMDHFISLAKQKILN